MINSINFNKLYEEMYEPKLLPQDLLKNLELENYVSVDFSKSGNLLVGITKCILTNGKLATYIYTFSLNKLIKLEEKLNEDTVTILYDRQEEIKKLKKELKLDTTSKFVS